MLPLHQLIRWWQKKWKKFKRNLANPSSLHHEGEKAKNVLEEARIKIARILHCRANEVFYKRRY